MFKEISLIGLFVLFSNNLYASEAVVVADRSVNLAIDAKKTMHYFEDSHGHRWVTKIFLPKLQSQLIFDHRTSKDPELSLKNTMVRDPETLFANQSTDARYPVRITLTKSTLYDVSKRSCNVFLTEKVGAEIGEFVFESSVTREVGKIAGSCH